MLQLLHYLDHCFKVAAEGGVSDIIYLDYARAFDSVSHIRFLFKLKGCGIGGAALSCIENFLHERYQSAMVDGVESSRELVVLVSGVPQGSVLGPILFVLYVNNLLEIVESDIYMFAGDIMVLKQITGCQDSLELQRNLDKMEKWSQDWLLRFNPSLLELSRTSCILTATPCVGKN